MVNAFFKNKLYSFAFVFLMVFIFELITPDKYFSWYLFLVLYIITGYSHFIGGFIFQYKYSFSKKISKLNILFI